MKEPSEDPVDAKNPVLKDSEPLLKAIEDELSEVPRSGTELKLPEPRTTQEIKELAAWMEQDRVLSLITVPKEDWQMVFMPAFLGALEKYRGAEQSYGPAMIFDVMVFGVEGVDPVASHGINGFPVFMQCRFWRTSDFEKALRLAQAMRRAKESVLAGFEDQTGEAEARLLENPELLEKLREAAAKPELGVPRKKRQELGAQTGEKP